MSSFLFVFLFADFAEGVSFVKDLPSRVGWVNIRPRIMKTHMNIMAMGNIHHHPKPAQKASYPVICITSYSQFRWQFFLPPCCYSSMGSQTSTLLSSTSKLQWSSRMVRNFFRARCILTLTFETLISIISAISLWLKAMMSERMSTER